MRRIPLIIGLVLIAGMIARDIYDCFVTNEGIAYFSSKSNRLLYVMLLGVGGGVVAYGISRLSPKSQSNLKLLALGGFGGVLVVAAAFFGHLLCRLAVAPLIEAHLWGWIIAAFCSMAAAAVLVWLEFRQVWRQTR